MGFKIVATGDFACFTRPEMKVERVSYDVPTPSALEGLLKSIYWKPNIRYVIDKIIVYNPIEFINIRRNELKEKVSIQNVKKQMKSNCSSPILYASEQRTQRSSMILKNVKYGIDFHFEMTQYQTEKADESSEKHYNIILRRLKNGQSFRHPCFGCREFPVKDVILVDDFDLKSITEENKGDIDLGFMLYGMRFKDNGIPINGDWDNPIFSDVADAVFYRPHMIDGIIDVMLYREAMIC